MVVLLYVVVVKRAGGVVSTELYAVVVRTGESTVHVFDATVLFSSQKSAVQFPTDDRRSDIVTVQLLETLWHICNAGGISFVV